MPVSDEFLIYVEDQLRGFGEVVSRRMFGGVGLYHQNRMFGLIAEDMLYLKTDASTRGEYQARGYEAFKPFDDKPIVMSYHEVPAEILEEPAALSAWARTAFGVTLRTPVKKRKSRK